MTQICQVDAFTNKPFSGNSAGVCILKQPKSDEWMQNLAMEMNLSETAFVVAEDSEFHIRWFTPVCEVDLCGHATLATAHVIFQHKLTDKSLISFRSNSGPLLATQRGDWITLDFPANEASACEMPAAMEELFTTPPQAIWRNSFAYLVELENASKVKNWLPDFYQIEKLDALGLLVTAPGDENYDFVSRCFFPKLGIAEDPVTGAAHCTLGPYWSQRLQRHEFLAYQASARGGELKVQINGDRVMLSGQAITTMNIQLLT